MTNLNLNKVDIRIRPLSFHFPYSEEKRWEQTIFLILCQAQACSQKIIYSTQNILTIYANTRSLLEMLPLKINECSEHIDGDCIVFVECKIVFYWIILLCVFHSIVYSDPINFIFVYSTSFKAKSIRSSDRAFSVTENHIVDAKAISNNVSERPHQ